MEELKGKTKKELIIIAKRLGLKNYSKLKKEQLLEKILSERRASKISRFLKNDKTYCNEIDYDSGKIGFETLKEHKKRNKIALISLIVAIVGGILIPIFLLMECNNRSFQYKSGIQNYEEAVQDSLEYVKINITEKIINSIKFSIVGLRDNLEIVNLYIEIKDYYECQKWDIHILAEHPYNNYKVYLTPEFRRYRLPVPTVNRGYDTWVINESEIASFFAIIDMNKYDLANIVVVADIIDHNTNEKILIESNSYSFYGKLCKQDSLVKKEFLNEQISISPYLYKLLVCIDIWDKIDKEYHRKLNEEAFGELASLFDISEEKLKIILEFGDSDLLDDNLEISSEYKYLFFKLGQNLLWFLDG